MREGDHRGEEDQHLVCGSLAWWRTYATCRDAIEGRNGFLKDPAHECLGAPARRRIRGITAQSLLVAFLVMAGNVRALRAHRELVAQQGGRERAATRARRRRTSLEDFSPPA